MRGEAAIAIFRAGVAAADPERAVRKALSLRGDHLETGGWQADLGRCRRVLCLGAGKGAAPMARAVEGLLGPRLDGGLVIVKEGHGGPLEHVGLREASHPLPDRRGMMATTELVSLAAAGKGDLVICLLSGGASALLVSPAAGLTLEDKRAVSDLLLRAGADITRLNAVRKHLSAVKGGQLARLIHPASLLTLLVSDVVGDRLDVIASGPTVPDPSSFVEAWSVVSGCGLEKSIPVAVRRHLRRGMDGQIPETPKPGDPCFEGNGVQVVANLGTAMDAAAREAVSLGFTTRVVGEPVTGEARKAARLLARLAAEVDRPAAAPPVCIISGGETTVTVTGRGRGGRNQEMALAFALEVEGREDVVFLAAGTDGTDGPTDAAGAVVDGGTARRARERGVDPMAFLGENDSYGFFAELDGTSIARHLKTGPTGTNVLDLQVAIVG